MSFGVRGARISTGPRGTYVHVGAGGFRYSQRIDGHRPRPKRLSPPPSPTLWPLLHYRQRPPAVPSKCWSRLHSSSPAPTSCSRKSARKEQAFRLVPLVAGVSAIGLVSFLVLSIPPTRRSCGGSPSRRESSRPRLTALGRVGRSTGAPGPRPLCARSRRRHRPGGAGADDRHAPAGARDLGRTTRTCHGDWKRHAGAGTSVGRRLVGVGFGAPPFIQTNARVGFLSIDGTRLYFFPDRLLIFGRGGARAIPYSDLTIRAGTIRFVEEGGVPRDAHVIGKTWRYVNKDGSPDRRFRDNYQIPVVLYGTLEIAAPSGLRLSLQTSADGLATGTEKLLHVVQDAIRQLKSRRATPPQLEPLPDFPPDPPPLILPMPQSPPGYGPPTLLRVARRLAGMGHDHGLGHPPGVAPGGSAYLVCPGRRSGGCFPVRGVHRIRRRRRPAALPTSPPPRKPQVWRRPSPARASVPCWRAS